MKHRSTFILLLSAPALTWSAYRRQSPWPKKWEAPGILFISKMTQMKLYWDGCILSGLRIWKVKWDIIYAHVSASMLLCFLFSSESFFWFIPEKLKNPNLWNVSFNFHFICYDWKYLPQCFGNARLLIEIKILQSHGLSFWQDFLSLTTYIST